MVRHTRGACGPGSEAHGQLCQERREEVLWDGVYAVTVSCWPSLSCFHLQELPAVPRLPFLLQGSNYRWSDGLRRRLVCPADRRSPKQPRRKLVCPADHLRIPRLPSRQKRNNTHSPMSAMRKCVLFRFCLLGSLGIRRWSA